MDERSGREGKRRKIRVDVTKRGIGDHPCSLAKSKISHCFLTHPHKILSDQLLIIKILEEKI